MNICTVVVHCLELTLQIYNIDTPFVNSLGDYFILFRKIALETRLFLYLCCAIKQM